MPLTCNCNAYATSLHWLQLPYPSQNHPHISSSHCEFILHATELAVKKHARNASCLGASAGRLNKSPSAVKASDKMFWPGQKAFLLLAETSGAERENAATFMTLQFGESCFGCCVVTRLKDSWTRGLVDWWPPRLVDSRTLFFYRSLLLKDLWSAPCTCNSAGYPE